MQLWTSEWTVVGIAVFLLCGVMAGACALNAHLRRRIGRLESRLLENKTVLDARQTALQGLEMELATASQRLRKLKRLVAIDPLTGIPNRRHFDRTLEREIRRARRDRLPVSLLFCDIDGFKSYNDSQGHARGDEALKLVARTLAETFRRGSDLAARYGGEEFVVVLPGIDGPKASIYAERLRRRIWRLEIPYPGAPVADRLTISAGVATLTPDELGGDPLLLARAPEVLINSADAALYRAKCLGRNRVAVKSSAGPGIAAVQLAS